MISLSPETKLELVFDALETGVILYEPVFTPGNDLEPSDFTVPYCNKKVAEMSGAPLETIRNQRILSLINVDEERRQTLFQQISAVYNTEERSVHTSYNASLDRYFQQTRTKVGNAVIAEIKDVTSEVIERKERERQIAFTDQILDQSINGWLTCEVMRNDEGEVIDFIITRINAAFTRMLGLSGETAIGKLYLSLFPTAKATGMFQLNCRVMQSGISERKMIHHLGDGTNAWYDIMVSKLENNLLLINFADISILGEAPYGIIQYKAVYDENGQLVDFVHRAFNEVAMELAEVSFDDFSTKTAYEIADERKNRILVDTGVQVVKTATPARFEYFVEKAGKWVDLSLVPYEDGVLMNFVDITPRIIQEKKVQQAADQFLRIIDASLNGIYVWKAVRDETGAIVDLEYTLANKTFERLNGKSSGEVIGKTALQLYPGLKGTKLFNRYIQVIETGEAVKFEDYYKDEELDMWFEASAVKIGEDEVFISYRDITEQKLSAIQLHEQNALLDSILSNSPSGIVVVRMMRNEKGNIIDGQVILMNDAAERYTQYPKEVMLTKTSKEMEPHILESPVYRNIVKMMDTGEPFHIEYQMEMTGRWVYMNVAKIDDDHLVNVFTDITESKTHRLEQERMLYELKRSNEALEEFARAASHDLKEPIRKIQFFVSRLRQDFNGAITNQQADLFNRVEKAADRMRLLVEDLLAYSHLSTNPREKESIDLNKKLQNVIDDLELLVLEKKAKIHIGELPTVLGYRRQLQQLFQNLITNAIKYSRPGVDPHIKVSSKIVTGKDSGFKLPVAAIDQQFHLIEVSDNGIGFEPEHAERIFDVFTRLHGNNEYPGTGIGLSIVKKVAENHGGYVMAKGEKNMGSSFFVLFPF